MFPRGGGGTHITRDMRFPGRETHITSNMCLPGKHILLGYVFPRWGNIYH